MPFPIPDSWEWRKLGEIGKWQSGGTPSRLNKEYYGGNIPWLKTGDLHDGYVLDIPEHITQKALEETSVKLNPTGSVLIAMYGATIGKVGILTFPATTNQACCACVDFFGVEQKYLFYFLLSHKEEFVMLGGGGAQPNISKEKIINTLIPIPPITEQRRIIESIEQWISSIESLENGKVELKDALQGAKSKILDFAIHGKLVSQNPDDEPAIELLKRINPKFTPCDNAHCPYDIPSGWEWSKGSMLFEKMESCKPIGKDFIYIDVDAIDNKQNKIANPKILLTSNAPSRATRKLHTGDVLFSMVRPYLKNIALVTDDYGQAIGSTGFYVLSPIKAIHSSYLFYMVLSSYVIDGLNEFMKGDNSPSINNKNIEEFLYPVPPYNEQQRIVEKIEELFAVLDEMKESLEA